MHTKPFLAVLFRSFSSISYSLSCYVSNSIYPLTSVNYATIFNCVFTIFYTNVNIDIARLRTTLFKGNNQMLTFLVWLILLVLCWPLALLALILYPIVWIILLPFRIIGIAVGGVLALIKAIIMLPARILRGPQHLK